MKTRGRIVSFLLLLVIFASTIGTTVNPILKDVKLGLDLQGGFEVLYEVKNLKMDKKLLKVWLAIQQCTIQADRCARS